METLSNKVKDLRINKGLTQGELADLIGVTRQTVISLEKGSYVPSLILAMKISKVFGFAIEDIFYQED